MHYCEYSVLDNRRYPQEMIEGASTKEGNKEIAKHYVLLLPRYVLRRRGQHFQDLSRHT